MTLPLRSRKGGVFTLPLLVLVIALFSRGLSQTAREKQLHQLNQVENSNRTVARFFRDLSIPYKSDTVYVFIVPPMNAARVEGAINPFISLLRKAGVKTDIVTLAVFNRRRAAERYLQRRAFASDYSLATDEKFLSSFIFSAGTLQVPFVTRFCVRTGELLSSYSLLGTVDSAAVAWFIADLSKPKATRPVSKRPRITRTKTEVYRPVVGKWLKLHDSDEFPLSTSRYASVNPAGSRISLMDNLTNYVYVFDLTTGRLLNVLFPDSSEEKLFINVPAAAYQFLKQNNVINSMYFSHGFCDDTTLIIAASLPRIVMEVTGEDTNFGVHNAPVLIRKNILNNRPIGYAGFKSLPDTTRGEFSHKGASFEPRSNLVFVPFRKGWPSGSQLLSDITPREDNPFTDEFYQRAVYQFAAYTLDGEFVGFWGRLGDRFEKLRLGYYAGGGLVRFRDGKYYLSDQHSGRIYSYNPDATLSDSITLFDDPPLVIPTIDRSQEPVRYLVEAFKQNFRARIVDFLVTQDLCYALLLFDESQPVVCRVGLKDRSTREYALPARYEGKEAKHCLLRETPSGVVTASLLESPDETYYCEFRIPGGR